MFGHFIVLAGLISAVWAAPEKPKLTTVDVQAAKATQLFTLLTYPARLHPKINATVLSETEGVVTEIPAPLGAEVKKNEQLVVIKNTDPIYHYAPVRVGAPVKGVVSSMEVSVGSRVTRGQKLATITDPSQVLITVEIAASDLFTIRKGQKGDLRLPGSNENVALEVRGVSPFVDPATGTATAELVLIEKPVSKEGNFPLPPGSVGQVSFRSQEHAGIELPESAVIYRGKDTFVRVVESGKIKYVPVGLGPTHHGMVEIAKGLTEGANVVLRSSGYVSDGEEVLISKDEKKG